MKLDTAAAILAWVSGCSRTGCGCCSEADSPEDIAEAAYLAYCVRVTAEIEKRSKGAGHCAGDGCTYCPAVADYCRLPHSSASGVDCHGRAHCRGLRQGIRRERKEVMSAAFGNPYERIADLEVERERLLQVIERQAGPRAAEGPKVNWRVEFIEADNERVMLRAEVERLKAEWMPKTFYEKAVAERDALKAELAKAKEEMARDAAELRTLDDLRQQLAEAKAERERALDLARHAEHYDKLHQGKYSALVSRIEALADEWEEYGTYPQMLPELRALLQPPKEETALDVVAELERWNFGVDKYNEQVARLRKLLEEKKSPGQAETTGIE